MKLEHVWRCCPFYHAPVGILVCKYPTRCSDSDHHGAHIPASTDAMENGYNRTCKNSSDCRSRLPALKICIEKLSSTTWGFLLHTQKKQAHRKLLAETQPYFEMLATRHILALKGAY